MLCKELQEKDIPHRDTMRARLLEMVQEHFTKLDQDMAKVSTRTYIYILLLLNYITFRML